MAVSPVTKPPLIKIKWLIPFAPWVSVSVAAAKHPAYWMSLEGRILHVIGVAVYSVAFLAVIQPWRRDDETAVTR